MKSTHPLWSTLATLEGNQKACVLSEPLWAIPTNLFLPYASIYMAALGLHDEQIGLVVSLGLGLQLIWALFSGGIIDKFGRRKSMLVFGLISWVVPCILWATAQNIFYFAAAVFFNSMMQVINNSFSCMIVEDGDTGKLVNIYTILNLIGLIAGFISPLAGLCIDHFMLVPTMRVIYILSMVLMTCKFILQYRLSCESRIGMKRIEECRSLSLYSLTFSGWGVFINAMKQKRLLAAVFFMAVLLSFNTVQATFWPLFITRSYAVSDTLYSVFPLVTSFSSLLIYLLITPRINFRSVRNPLFAGIGLHLLGLSALFIFLPFAKEMLWVVFFSAICEAFALAILGPLCETIMSLIIPSGERARTNSFIVVIILLISTPAGWAAGSLSRINPVMPMILNFCLAAIAFALAVVIVRILRKDNLTGITE